MELGIPPRTQTPDRWAQMALRCKIVRFAAKMAENYTTDLQNREVLEIIFDGAIDFYRAIAPNGLVNSEYIYFFHPTPAQLSEEYARMSENINRLLKKEPEKDLSKEESPQVNFSEINEFDEFIQILGLSVYDIFSNNHTVIDKNGKEYDLGSMRGTGRYIADFINNRYYFPSGKYGYLDFYMGTIWIKTRANLLPFYEYIFNKLRQLKCEWIYTYPRLYLLDLSKVNSNMTSQDAEKYDPAESVLQEIEAAKKSKKLEDIRQELDDAYREGYEAAKYKPLEPLVKAYKNIYGKLPDGHPITESE